MKKAIFEAINALGYELKKKPEPKLKSKPFFFETEPFLSITNKVGPFTMTSPERLQGLYLAVNYVVDNNIEGDFVECGVWKGGSSMTAALSFLSRNETSKKLWLFDTFDGMGETTEFDIHHEGYLASEILKRSDKNDSRSAWCAATYEEVVDNMKSTNYPFEKIKFIKGKVEETLTQEVPEKISILRLDTDYYSSTKAELEILYDKLVPGGVLILDDYGHWQGARKAVDEFFEKNGKKPLFTFLDYAGLSGIKPY
jgi:O-methyltransferase